MNFRHLEVFYAVMTAGTVTGAARQLGVSQPSVTTTIKAAETGLGLQLFLREGGRLIPTDEARTLFEEAQRAHDALASLTIIAEGLKLGQGGHVRIAAVPTLSLDLLPDAIAAFEERHTGFRYSVETLDSDAIIEQLDNRKGTYHLGFVFGMEPDAGLSFTEIGKAKLFAVFPAGWDVSDGPEINVATFEGRPHIGGYDGTALAQERNRLFAAAGIEPTVIVRGHNHRVAGALVERGLGWTILDSLTTQAMLQGANRETFAVRQIEGASTLPVVAAYPSKRQLSNAIALFIECFQEAFDRLESQARAEGREAAAMVP
jgi:DNA-binding transcriptional LysR family regulator